MMFRLSAIRLLAVLLLAGSGCAQTATVTYWQPPQIGPHNFERIAVATISGDGGTDVADAIQSRIGETEEFILVDSATLEPEIRQAALESESLPDNQELLSAARRVGLDALIDGEVIEYSSTPPPGERTKADAFRSVDQARVSVVLRLINVETGETLEEREVSRSYDRKRKGDRRKASNRLPVMERLTDECVAEFMKLLAPHQADAQVELANGDLFQVSGLDVQRGVKLAVDGQWAEAEQIWKSVVEHNPENDAALFNLAVAAANREDYCAAEDYAMQALRLRHTDRYAKGLDQIRQFRSDQFRIERDCQATLTAGIH